MDIVTRKCFDYDEILTNKNIYMDRFMWLSLIEGLSIGILLSLFLVIVMKVVGFMPNNVI